jgi:protocatechuate 3,4-dioxygenase beta subunit
VKVLVLLASLATTVPVPAAAELALHGRVLAPGGAPLAGVKVRLFPFQGERERGERLLAGQPAPTPTAQAETDSDGAFTLAAPEAGFWTLLAGATGYVAQERHLLPLVEEIELEAVEFSRERLLEVKVTGTDGRPIQRAWIEAVPRERRLFGRVRAEEEKWSPASRLVHAATGAVSLPRAEGERLTVRVFAPGFREAEMEVTAQTAVTLTLAAAGPPVPIEVREAAGRPVASALILAGAGRWPLGLTAGDGRLTVRPPVAEGEVVHALAAGGHSASARLATPAPNRPAALLRLPTTAPVAGRVLDALRREPLAEAFVWLRGDPATAVRTDRAGAYRLAAVPVLPAAAVLAVAPDTAVVAVAPGYLRETESLQAAAEERGPVFALDPSVRLRGRVFDAATKAGLAGVEVRWGRARARTGADGKFELRGLAAGHRFELLLTRTGYAPRREPVPPIAPGAPLTLELSLDRGRRAIGRIVDPQEQPLAGATVTLYPAGESGFRRRRPEPGEEWFHASTDARGVFAIAGVPAGRYNLEARAAQLAPRVVPGLEIPAGEREHDVGTIALRPGASLTGRVTDAKGRPIAEAEIRIVESGRASFLSLLGGLDEEPAALSAADGRFGVTGLDPSQAVDVTVTRHGYGRAESLRVEPAGAPLAITLHPALRLSGRVVGPRGEPVPRAQLILAGMRQHGGDVAMSTPLRGESDEEGRFAFKDVEPGTLQLIATVPGWQPGTFSEISAAGDRDVEGLELVLSPAGAVEGRVTDADGRPVAGAWVRPAEAETFDLSRFFGSSGTDGDGWYRVEGLAPGPRSLAAEDEQGRRTVGEVEVRSGVTRLDLRFRRGVEVAGRAIDAEGAPAAGVWVDLIADSAVAKDHSVSTGADGTFVFDDVEDGTYRLEVSSKGHATAELGPLEIAGAAVSDLEVRLQSGGTIVGRLLGVEPELLSRIRVHGARRGESFQSQGGMVDPEGRYRLPNVAAGEWLVIAELANSGRRVEGLVTLEPGVAEATLDLDFDTGFTLSGRVTRDGAPLPGATIEARGRGVSDHGSASTDRDGRFRIGSLEEGTYEVTVHAGSATRREEMTLTGDREVSFELEMAAVAGRVIDAIERTPVAGALVRVETANPDAILPWRNPAVAMTDSRGRFRFSEVAAGTWRLRVEREGYGAAERALEVEAGVDAEELEVALESTQGLVLDVERAAGGVPPAVVLAVVDASGRTIAGGAFPTGSGGRVRLPSVPAGTFGILAAGEGLAVERAVAVVPGPPVSLALAPEAAVELRVPALRGAGGVTVGVRGADGTVFLAPAEWSRGVDSEWWMQGGELRLRNLPAGVWTVEARAPDGRVWSGTVTLVPGQTAELVLE